MEWRIRVLRVVAKKAISLSKLREILMSVNSKMFMTLERKAKKKLLNENKWVGEFMDISRCYNDHNIVLRCKQKPKLYCKNIFFILPFVLLPNSKIVITISECSKNISDHSKILVQHVFVIREYMKKEKK